MPEETRPHLCGATLVCPECGEEVRKLPPTDMAPGYARPDYSHHDGSTLCPVLGYQTGGYLGGRKPAEPVAFLQVTVLTRT
ncbi:hypothetical protein PWG71_08620 [Nocardiopsis sp. N85]|uniref:hypothetical protein n=1 Tax=Nocardiopsis sp. N85 TaxID=3029400 RepID=UPI00237F7FD8|nr:hypothetical protein [Nocardiopsis sp. N85]MDE3721451.1 hypothetical protein [Nocardiopsis sp. N85]